MKPLHIAVAMPQAPLPFGHASGRWHGMLLKSLLERGHKVTAFAAVASNNEIKAALDLYTSPAFHLRCYRRSPESGIRSRVRSMRQPCSYVFSCEMRRDIAAIIQSDVDVLHLEEVWSGWLGLTHLAKSLLHIHNLWTIDIGQIRHAQPLPWLKRRLLFKAERKIVSSYPNICCVSSRLEGEIRQVNQAAQIDRIPAALDLSGYQYIPDSKRTIPKTLSLIGSMGWAPTFSAAERLILRLWPEIKRCVPGAALQIVGWGAKKLLGCYSTLPDVTIEENVPDIRPYFEKSTVLLYAPGRGSGMKIKVLEALAFGVPVVTNTEGIEGVPAIDGIHAGIAEDDRGLIQRTIRLLQNEDQQNTQRRLGRKLLDTECNPNLVVDKLESIYRRISKSLVGTACQ